MVELRTMEVFVEVVDAGSFARVARAQGLAPSSISRTISSLEDRLGVRLLQRTTRKLSPTEAGAVFYERARLVLDEAREATQAASHYGKALRGTLRVSLSVTFGRRYIAPILPEFLADVPELRVELVHADRYVDLVEEGFDLAIRVGKLVDSSLVAKRLATDRRVLVASPDYLARRGRPECPADLEEHDCLTFSVEEPTTHWRFRRPEDTGATPPQDVRVHGSLVANAGDFILEALLAGCGVGLIPAFLAWEGLADGRLVELLTEWEPTTRDFGTGIWAVYPTRRYVPAKVQRFISFLDDRLATAPWARSEP